VLTVTLVQPSPAASAERLAYLRATRDAFHLALFNHFEGVDWLGVQVLKTPMDLMVYQEIIVQRKPDLIIECGSFKGGSALFMAHICDLVDHGRIVSVDVVVPPDVKDLPWHPRITWYTGDSVSKGIIEAMQGERYEAESCMVILDSNHSRGHVLRELKAYAPMVTLGDYLVVEDTNVNGHPVLPEHGPGPWEAVGKFLEDNSDQFRIDVAREKFLVSFNPGGFLVRVAN